MVGIRGDGARPQGLRYFGVMRVLHVDSATEWRGGQVQLLHLVRGMRSRGRDVAVACPQAGRLYGELAFLGEDRIAIPAGVSARAVARLRGLSCDLLAAHTSHAHTNCALSRRPFVVHRRVDFVPSGGWKYRQPLGFIAVSQAVADILDGVGAAPSVVVHDGVEALPEAPPAHDGPTVLAVGALVPHKGHEVLVRAAQLLGEDVDIGIAGEGALRPAGRVRFLGHRDDVPALLAAARVFVHPSVEEGMGQAAVEAMLSGVPVVVSDAGGLPEVVGDCGIVVPRGDAEALAAGIGRALAGDHPPVEAARARARERFSVDAMVEGTLRAYATLLG